MSIRSNGIGRYHTYGNDNVIRMGSNLQRLVQRNGLDAYIRQDSGGNLTLVVGGNRGYAYSPVKEYKITPQQLAILMKSGRESFDKKAYNTFNEIIAKDFVAPEAYVVANNTGIGRNGMNMRTPVIMGWGGIPVARSPFGFAHLEGRRPDGRRLPGESAAMRELPDGSYVPTAGYVWKGNLRSAPNVEAAKNIEIKNIQAAAPVAAKRPEPGQAIPLSTLAKSAGNDTFVQLQEVMESHGIFVREMNGEKLLYIKALNERKNVKYTLTDEQFKMLTADGWRKDLDKRLEFINKRIEHDFKEPITRDMLNTKDYVNITFNDEARAIYDKDFIEYEQQQKQQAVIDAAKQEIDAERMRIMSDPNAIDGREVSNILKGKAFFNNISHGRQVVVGEIRVDDHYEQVITQMNSVQNRITKMDTDLQKKIENHPHLLQLKEVTSDLSRIEKDIEKMKNSSDPYKEEKVANMQERANSYRASIKHLQENIPEEIKTAQKNLEAEREHLKDLEAERKLYEAENAKGRYTMSALINGEWKYKTLTQKEYDRFLNYDDRHRLEDFVKRYDELKIDDGIDDSYDIIVKKTMNPGQGISVTAETAEQENIQKSLSSTVNANILSQLNAKKGFYADGKGGKERNVSEIGVARIDKDNIKDITEKLKEQNTRESRELLKDIMDKTHNGKRELHVMTAIVDGKTITKAISSKDFEKFQQSDDMTRLKLAAKLFTEFDIKTRPEFKVSTGKVVANVLGTIAGVGLAVLDLGDPGMRHGRMREPMFHRPMPGPPPAVLASEIYESVMQETTEENVGHEVSRGI